MGEVVYLVARTPEARQRQARQLCVVTYVDLIELFLAEVRRMLHRCKTLNVRSNQACTRSLQEVIAHQKQLLTILSEVRDDDGLTCMTQVAKLLDKIAGQVAQVQYGADVENTIALTDIYVPRVREHLYALYMPAKFATPASS